MAEDSDLIIDLDLAVLRRANENSEEEAEATDPSTGPAALAS